MSRKVPEHLKKRHPRHLPAPPPDRQVLSVLEAAGLLGLGETTVRAAVKAGTIPHTRYGKRILFRRDMLLKLMEDSA